MVRDERVERPERLDAGVDQLPGHRRVGEVGLGRHQPRPRSPEVCPERIDGVRTPRLGRVVGAPSVGEHRCPVGQQPANDGGADPPPAAHPGDQGPPHHGLASRAIVSRVTVSAGTNDSIDSSSSVTSHAAPK